MSVTLQSVTFNHDPTSSRGSALNIRINGSTPAQVPEWVNGASSTSPAAYAISDTLTARIQIAIDLVSAVVAVEHIGKAVARNGVVEH